MLYFANPNVRLVRSSDIHSEHLPIACLSNACQFKASITSLPNARQSKVTNLKL